MAPRKGQYKVLGWDAAGIVHEMGEDVTLFQKGDKVYYAGDVTRPGSNSEYQLVDQRIVAKMPTTLSFSMAAALPLTTITAWEMVFERLRIPIDRETTVLIVGAAGGVGSIMVQLINKLCTKATIIATASREESVLWCKRLGAHYVINHKESLSDGLKHIGIPQTEFVVGLNNTDDHFEEICKCVAPQGAIGIVDDPHPSKPLDITKLKLKSISFHWEFMFCRSMFQTPDMIEQHRLLNRVADMVDRGDIISTVAHNLGSINAANLKKAHSMLEKREVHGKIVLEGFQ
jgi:zinc-binding alcohol dehydrogenase family protein